MVEDKCEHHSLRHELPINDGKVIGAKRGSAELLDLNDLGVEMESLYEGGCCKRDNPVNPITIC